jgi:hypothetical protein
MVDADQVKKLKQEGPHKSKINRKGGSLYLRIPVEFHEKLGINLLKDEENDINSLPATVKLEESKSAPRLTASLHESVEDLANQGGSQ